MHGVAPERVPAGSPGERDDSPEYAELRRLLVAPELREIKHLRTRLEDPERRTEDVAEILAEAVRAARRPKVRQALQPILEDAIRRSVRQNPAILAESLFPVLGAMIRKSIAQALRSMTEEFERAMQNSFSLRGIAWRLEAWRTGRPFGEIVLVRSLLYAVEQVFLIHRETGLLLGHAVAGAAVVRDADMVSGMLTAIQDFVRDSFSGEERNLETMQVGELSVWVQYGPKAILAGVVRGMVPRELRSVFETAIERIHRDLAPPLEAFRGDSQPFEAAHPILESCLLGRGSGRKPSRMWYWVPAVALALLLLLGGAWLFSSWRDSRRFDAYLGKLRTAPGIVLVDARRDGSQYRISGLRDPLAPDPVALLAGSGLSPGRVSFAWEPYHSLQPPFPARREMDERIGSLERRKLHFDTAFARISSGQLFLLDEAAFDIRTLLDAASALGGTATVEVTGTADSPGTMVENLALANARTAEVIAALISRGVRPECMRPAPKVGQGDRTVSFHVVRQ